MIMSDKTHIKITIAMFVFIVVTIFGSAWKFSSYATKINIDIQNNTEDIKENSIKIDAVEADNVEIKVNLARIIANQERMIISVDRLAEKE